MSAGWLWEPKMRDKSPSLGIKHSFFLQTLGGPTSAGYMDKIHGPEMKTRGRRRHNIQPITSMWDGTRQGQGSWAIVRSSIRKSVKGGPSNILNRAYWWMGTLILWREDHSTIAAATARAEMHWGRREEVKKEWPRMPFMSDLHWYGEQI